ncbi:helix-turn-helix domain-containing protein [Amycolatopsis sp. cmx-4-68]|uniref:helix-turn-helix domain-containing protein n=1 Tax=Amycolatopsis sp. cmx-4-68 TaxID=2790938 RepID=UPI00397C8259
MGGRRFGFIRARKKACFTQESLAHALNLDPTTVGHWERGRTEPLPYKRPKLAKLLGVTPDELEDLLAEGTDREVSKPAPAARFTMPGSVTTDRALLPEPPVKVPAPQYEPSLKDALTTLAIVAGVDGHGFDDPEVVAFSSQLPAKAIRGWRAGVTIDDVERSGEPARVRDIDEVITTTKSLDQLDRQFGGDYSRSLAVKYLTDRVLPLLRRPASDLVRRELFQAAAVLCEVIGYMAYDAGLHRRAQHYFIQALRFTQEAGNQAYGSFVLGTMSHQALYLDRPDQALTLAQAAEHSAPSQSLAVVSTEAAMLEATASAALGDASGSIQALCRAEASYERHTATAETPYWMTHWDESVFASFASSAWLDLGDSKAAEPYLQTLWHGTGQQVRRQVFAAGQLARAALLEHDVEQSAHYGNMAAEAAAATGSKRSHRIVRDLLVRLDGHRQLRPVRELTDTVTELLPSEAP